ncbi:MAG: VWA domain-containing protein [Brumimicrobium sp.]|nr:VWA domain-containing protein [Brumimicrobium sp.]
MKTLLVLFVLLLGSSFTQNLVNPPETKRKIQIAILFDTSNSMDGLIDQAKTRIWSIVNTVSTLAYNNQPPEMEIALYEYGNNGLSEKDGFVRQISAFTTDLDDISSKLFALSTNGGNEFCGTVIQKSMNELLWSQDPRDMKLIYIAGNEPFNQGTIDYKETCKKAAEKGIYVSTIYCGSEGDGITNLWKDGAEIGKGKYLNIDSNKKIHYISTPYDDSIKKLNEALNSTYVPYGDQGRYKKEAQVMQDSNAKSMAEENMVERALSKSSGAYKNSGWDLIDYVGDDLSKLKSISEKDLPKQMQGKSLEENMKFLQMNKNKRNLIQNEIQELAQKRTAYIQKNASNSQEENDDFGAAVSASIMNFAKEKNYQKIK